MTESNNSENPCENCIVKSICITPCDELNNFAGKVFTNSKLLSPEWYNFWFKEYECRPGVIELDIKKEFIKWQNLVKKKSKK